MKKTLLALSLIGCLLLSAVSCKPDEPENEPPVVPGTADQVHDSGTAAGTDDNKPQETTNKGIQNGGANEDTGYGELHPVH